MQAGDPGFKSCIGHTFSFFSHNKLIVINSHFFFFFFFFQNEGGGEILFSRTTQKLEMGG